MNNIAENVLMEVAITVNGLIMILKLIDVNFPVKKSKIVNLIKKSMKKFPVSNVRLVLDWWIKIVKNV